MRGVVGDVFGALLESVRDVRDALRALFDDASRPAFNGVRRVGDRLRARLRRVDRFRFDRFGGAFQRGVDFRLLGVRRGAQKFENAALVKADRLVGRDVEQLRRRGERFEFGVGASRMSSHASHYLGELVRVELALFRDGDANVEITGGDAFAALKMKRRTTILRGAFLGGR